MFSVPAAIRRSSELPYEEVLSYDFHDNSKLWQDVARIIPVGGGDLVKYADDGLGNYDLSVLSPTDTGIMKAATGLYRNSASEFGTFLENLNLALGGKFTIAFRFRYFATGTDFIYEMFSFGPNLKISHIASDTIEVTMGAIVTTLAVGMTKHGVILTVDGANSSLWTQPDGGAETITPIVAGNMSTSRIRLYDNSDNGVDCAIYKVLVSKGIPEGQDLTDLEDWLGWDGAPP